MLEAYTERKALREHISWIREERRALAGEYWRSIERLRDLDEELKSEVEGNTEFADKLLRIIQTQNEVVEKVNKVMPHVPVESAVDMIDKYKGNMIGGQKEKEIIPNEQIELEKQKEANSIPVKARKSRDIKLVSVEVASMLKEHGAPMRLKDLIYYVERKHGKISNPTEFLARVMEYNNNVVRASRGFYQYKW